MDCDRHRRLAVHDGSSAGTSSPGLRLAYPRCPECAKAYGHNYVVIFAEVAAEPS
jgi:hypothetical protein